IDYRFAAEEARLRQVFAQRSRTFLETTRPIASTELVDAIRRHADQAPQDLRQHLRRKAIELARQVSTRHIDAWLAQLEPEAHALYAHAMNQFVELSNGFLAQLSASGDQDLAHLPSSVDPESGLRWDSRLYFSKLVQFAGDGATNWVLDRLRTRKAVLRSVESTTAAYLVRLLEANAVGVENDLNLRVLESRRRFRSELHRMIHDLVSSAAGALDRSRQAHAQGSAAVQAELAHNDELMAQLSTIVSPHCNPSAHPAAS
ncbi:MAG: hypothetical protein GXP62_07765, partial [Oligoflexia bacterium]|nr:hypothetical protein [Oligoflexia bacterium]